MTPSPGARGLPGVPESVLSVGQIGFTPVTVGSPTRGLLFAKGYSRASLQGVGGVKACVRGGGSISLMRP